MRARISVGGKQSTVCPVQIQARLVGGVLGKILTPAIVEVAGKSQEWVDALDNQNAYLRAFQVEADKAAASAGSSPA